MKYARLVPCLSAAALAAALVVGAQACASEDCRPYAGDPGACNNFVGYTFDGERCVPRNGCLCEGDGCPGVYAQLRDCENAHRACSVDAPAGE